MEEKDISIIAGAVAKEIAKLNVEKPEIKNEQEEVEEGFSCPDCGTPVKGMTKYCPGCGCELEWGA